MNHYASFWQRFAALRIHVFVLLPLAFADAAFADAAPPDQNRISVDLGVASAVGGLGVTYSYFSDDSLGLEAGLGLGATGPQLSLMPKLRLGAGRHRFVAGAGLSAGIFAGVGNTGPEHQPHPDVVWFLNADVLGYEYRSGGAFAFGFALGLTTNLNRFHWDVADIGSTEPAWSVFPQARVSFARWF